MMSPNLARPAGVSCVLDLWDALADPDPYPVRQPAVATGHQDVLIQRFPLSIPDLFVLHV